MRACVRECVLASCVCACVSACVCACARQDFSMADDKHRARPWIGRVKLLFTCTFEDRDGMKGEYDLAFLSFLRLISYGADAVQCGSTSIMFILSKKTLDHSTARQSYSGQGAAHAGVPC